jgi:Tfp pilus assembly PilM family ATPase/Tfp pilus assembly protein PilN
MARTVTGIDIGLRNAKFVRGSYKGNTFHVTGFAISPLASKEVTEGWDAAEPGFKPLAARVGLTGRDVNIRYVRVPRVPDWQLRNLMRFEVAEIGDQSGAGVASDFNLLPELPEIEGEDVVLLAMARESLLEAHAAGLERLGGKLDSFSPNAIALYNAYVRFGVVQDEVVLLANIGHENLDVVIVRGPDLLFARNLSGGSKLFDDAIAQRLGIGAEKAAEVKHRLATLEPGARFDDPNAEKASRAMLAAGGQVLSLLQSAVLFCKSQVKVSGLKLDRVLLCGGGAAQKGLAKYLSSGMSVPVELFDPFRVVDVTALPEEDARLLERHRLESVVALGLATMASDPDAWGIEILPASLRAKRELWGAKVFLYAAAALALVYLGYDGWRTSRELESVRRTATDFNQQYKRASQTHRKAEELSAENARLAAIANELALAQGSGEQIARSLDVLAGELPPDFWLTQLSSDWRADPELGLSRGSEAPVLSITGRAREGTTALATLYEGFIASLHARMPPSARLKERLNPNGSKFTVDLSFFAREEPAGEPAASGDGDAVVAPGAPGTPETPAAPRGGESAPSGRKPSARGGR